MTWHKWGQFKEGPQDLHELHVSNVYQDSEFIKDVQIVFPERDKLLKLRREKSNYDTADKQFVDGFKAIDKREYEKLARKYLITQEDVVWYLNGSNERTGEFYRKSRKPFKLVDYDESTVTMEFRRDITKEDYIEAWNQFIIRMKGKATQPKLPVHDKLLYAIFKAREQRGESFRQIFEQYENGTLPNYDGANTMFASNQKKFEDYDRKYAVDQPPT